MQWELRLQRVKLRTDGSSSRQDGIHFASLFMEVHGPEVEEELLLWPRRVGEKEFGLANGLQSKRKHGESRSLRFRRGDK